SRDWASVIPFGGYQRSHRFLAVAQLVAVIFIGSSIEFGFVDPAFSLLINGPDEFGVVSNSVGTDHGPVNSLTKKRLSLSL
ncbi:MAG: hypothetical protein OXF07_15205, partial [Rhodobacter sp.]|nr:hypothetical protein [Rhodobacter sp.]